MTAGKGLRKLDEPDAGASSSIVLKLTHATVRLGLSGPSPGTFLSLIVPSETLAGARGLATGGSTTSVE
jgi:hypothetical protein